MSFNTLRYLGVSGVKLGRDVTIIRNPSDDRDFERAIDELLSEGAQDPAALEARLRARYPHAVVRPRDLDAESIQTWYVYREGHWTRGDPA